MWRFWIDTGGTFTDCLAETPDGEELRAKTLSSSAIRGRVAEKLGPRSLRLDFADPVCDGFFSGYSLRVYGRETFTCGIASWGSDEGVAELDREAPDGLEGSLCSAQSPEEAPLLAMRLLTRTLLDQPLPKLDLKLATTRATNALLESKGARIAFLVTKGFRDLVRIGDQRRPDLFELGIRKRKPLYDRVFEVDERLDAEGNVLVPIDEQQISEIGAACVDEGIDSVAVAFLHSYRNAGHEARAEALLRRSGLKRVSLSSALAPLIKILPRAETALVDAYLAPIMETYLGGVGAALGESSISVMTSAGGLVSRSRYRPKDSLLSGPAGGVVGASRAGRQAGYDRVIAFDMGGTSADVSRYDGRFDYQYEKTIGDARVFAPALRIETVAAGGGSICWFDGSALRVGPESAGAAPGPASYGAGGPLTITDVHLLLGRLDPSQFRIPVFAEAAEKRLQELLETVERESKTSIDRDGALRGLLDIANERMADAIRSISLKQGFSPSEYALVAFGGAGGLHACAIADILEMDTIVFPTDAGLLSAFGLQQASLEEIRERQILEPLEDCRDSLEPWVEELEEDARRALLDQGAQTGDLQRRNGMVEMRFLGQEASLLIAWDGPEGLETAFLNVFEKQYGFVPSQRIEAVSLKVSVSTKEPDPDTERFPDEPEWVAATGGSYSRESLAGKGLVGPAIVQDPFSTVYVEEGWQAVASPNRVLKLTRVAGTAAAERAAPEAARLELFTNRFLSLVEEMGSLLERSAFSTNVKERKDFSCALLDRDGCLIANAPHIPVHLGALGMCVREVRKSIDLGPGDVVVTNHPAYGGSHLPDVTLIAGVYSDEGELLGYVANRAHHAELGGIVPGSMPPGARSLQEEGVVISPMHLVKAGEARWEHLEAVLTQAPFPTRKIEENRSDLAAQLASARLGAFQLRKLAREEGAARVAGYMEGLKRRASKALETAIGDWAFEEGRVVEHLDNGAEIAVRLMKKERLWVIDFSGSAAAQESNYNATRAVVTSAVVYVMRLLAGGSIPLNEGLLDQVELRIPEGMLNPAFPSDPAHCPPVVAGNVEISQRIVDTLIKAFAIAACSQGTMNNLIFGNERASYYETIAGGEGATRERPGASGVHTHMTNTAITDPEILEWRFPARLERFAIREGSGGKGLNNGGDGVIRRVRFLETVNVSLLMQHRKEAPFGMDGGGKGSPGEQWKIGPDGRRSPIEANRAFEFQPGEAVEILTPGGGGYGRP